MPGVVINGRSEPIGIDCSNWFDDPGLRLDSTDMRLRRPGERVTLIVLHTSRGIPGGKDRRPQVIRPGFGPGTDGGGRLVRWWTRSPDPAGAHLVVDFDGRVYCCADLEREATYHAGHANGASVGIEIVQGGAAELYAGQIEATVKLCDFLTRRFGIQRQIPGAYRGPVRRLMDSVADYTGVIGHRELTDRRGQGDPGDHVMSELARAGYERWDLDLAEDRAAWRIRQRDVGVAPQDGIPGPQTRAALLRMGHAHGLWVARAGD